MICPKCGCLRSKVVDSRVVAGGRHVRRRRRCLKCSERFTTKELYVPESVNGRTAKYYMPDEIDVEVTLRCDRAIAMLQERIWT